MSQTFDGLMDDLRFYNRVLTENEIRLLAGLEPNATREEVVANSLTLSPNPVAANQQVNISIDRSVFGSGSPVRLNVVDASGRMVLQRTYEVVGDRLTLDHGLQSGVYTVTMSNGKRLATSRFVVR